MRKTLSQQTVATVRPLTPAMPAVAPVAASAATPPATARPLRCQVLTDWDQAEPLAAAWDDLVGQVHGDIYFTLDWCRTWWRHYGRGRRLNILLFWDGPTLVGLLPLMVDRLWLGPVPLRLAKLVGADFTTIVLNPPVAPDHAAAAYAAALGHLLVDGGCDAVWFGPLAGHRPHRHALRQACQACGPAVRLLSDRDAGVHAVFHLPDTFEKYLASLDKSQRGNYLRSCRTLDTRFAMQADCLRRLEQIESPFEEFLSLHTAQWRSHGMLGHFHDWPAADIFNRDLIRAMAPQDRLWLHRLSSQGRTLAYEYSYRLGDWLYWRLPARRTGEPWDRLGIGRVSLTTLVQTAIAAGVRHIEAGPGHYDYKIHSGATEYPLGSMLIVADTAWVRAKTRLWGRWANLLHLLYYRIWFSRIAAHLPLPRRPLWRTWVRSHL
jgi:CelD/BcsL family acetyltransferase involved in cellulose biosynthesis